MREDWVSTKLAHIANLINGDRGKNYPSQQHYISDGIPFISAANLDQGRILINHLNYISEDRYKLLNSGKLVEGDLIYCLRGTLGKSAIFENIEKAAIASSLVIIRLNPLVNPEFVFYYLNSPFGNKLIQQFDNGTAQPNLSAASVKKYIIPLAAFPEQRAIVAKIEQLFSELDNGIANLKAAQGKLDIYRQAVLKKAFEGELTKEWRKQQTDLPTADELLQQIKQERQRHYAQQLVDWEQAVEAWEAGGREGKKPSKPKKSKKLEEIKAEELIDFPEPPYGFIRFGKLIKSIEAGKSFRCEERPPFAHEVGVAKVSAISWLDYDEQQSKTCTDNARINPDYLIKPGDFLFSRANTIELVGACVLVKKLNLHVMLSDKILRINYHSGIKSFFLYYLRSKLGRREIENRSTGNQDSMRNIGQDRLKSIVVPMYSDQEQTQIVQEIESRLSVCDNLAATIKQSLQQAEALRQSILKKAFEGRLLSAAELDACRAEADWEPAAQLLARIQQENK